ncbi:MAG: bifunctional methylenetetrahydrofolate dehydrogenase/methenyltetrahydrofolate cyclohydrolase [Candidatus Marinimicrobia bacterium]|nr:bifunctional methylenetetrahydrofolate dehydrogenase/methenyltetrahydrofolate cyclohydrolase [Candidatus Neomarinimicrobiota bacterium]|tara:strand:+ start:7547 stop:8425 length:879 start_codon:yes stop_codon:yes gene_type:complete
MSSLILKGKIVADSIKKDLEEDLIELKNKGIVPKLVAILIGNDPASEIYVKSKHSTFLKNNCLSDILRFPANTSEDILLKIIEKLNSDDSVHGILLQLPLPKHLDSNIVLNKINPLKDVDGFHPENLGLLLQGNPRFIPCTPYGCLKILEFYDIPVNSKHVVVVGRSNIVGKPIMALLSQKFKIGNATVTICHTGTDNLGSFTKQADIIIAATGVPKMITSDMVKDNCVIVDVGINRIDDESDRGYHIVGDVDYEKIVNKVYAITPVPGGVGPMTITMLLYNTIQSAKNKSF